MRTPRRTPQEIPGRGKCRGDLRPTARCRAEALQIGNDAGQHDAEMILVRRSCMSVPQGRASRDRHQLEQSVGGKPAVPAFKRTARSTLLLAG